MNNIVKKPVIFGEVSFNMESVDYVGSNVVSKKGIKKPKKSLKIGKVRVRKGLKMYDFSNFLLKSENFLEIGKRECYRKVIFIKKASYGGEKDQKTRDKLNYA